MAQLRFLLAWLLMAALPLQGMAAASMLFCGSQAAQMAAAGHHGHAVEAPQEAPGHDHPAVHGHSHGHAAHGTVSVVDGATHAPDAEAKSGLSHSCPICAACSQAQAVGGSDVRPMALSAPGSEPLHPAIRLSSRTLALPDKPPRV